MLVLGWRLINASVSIDLAKMSFSELLSVILAVFAIGLSIAFYFKATQTSNTFYDNTYRFTRDVSEMLGRIEAGFGERLKHLDEGYSGLVDKFAKMPFDFIEARKEIEQEEEEVSRKEKERDKIIEDLARKANLETKEKRRIMEQLQEKDAELLTAKKELSFLKGRLDAAATGTETSPPSDNILRRISTYFMHMIFPRMNEEIFLQGTYEQVSAEFDAATAGMSPGFLKEAARIGIVDSRHNLTRGGVALLRGFVRELPVPAVALGSETASPDSKRRQ